MSKRVLAQISPEKLDTGNRAAKQFHIMSNSNESVLFNKEILKEILRENNTELVKELPTKSDFQHLFTEITALKSKHNEMSAKILQLEQKNKALEIQMDKLIQKNIEKNLIVRLPIETNVDMTEKAKSVCSGLLNLNTNIEIESAFKVQTRDNQKATIVIQMKTREKALGVLRNSAKLKNTGISVNKDLPFNVRQRRSKLIKLMVPLRNEFPKKKIVLRDDRLHVEDKIFTWDNSDGLKCGNFDGIQTLIQIFGNISTGVRNTISELMNESPSNDNEVQLSNSTASTSTGIGRVRQNNAAVQNMTGALDRHSQ